MKPLSFFLFTALLLTTSMAQAAVEPNYVPDKPPVTNAWYAVQGEAERQADLDFIAGMRPHHAGALTMSQEYLAAQGARNGHLQQLAKGIIHNQTFEIGMLNKVEGFVAKPINGDTERRQIAEQGLAQKQRFVRAPMPGPIYRGEKAVTKRDVEFAKAMVIHHQAALDMAKEYLANPAANNKYLRLLCIDILTDQKQEIAFMNDIVSKYPGNPDDVKIDASMIHGMEGMHHSGHAMKGHEMKKQASKKKMPATHSMDHGMMNHDGMGH